MSWKDDLRIGDAIGLGITGVFTIGSLAAIVHARRKEQDDLAYLERCHSYYSGEIPGYASGPGDPYLVLVRADSTFAEVCEVLSTWFETSGEEARFVYDLAKRTGNLPPFGALIATAHHRKAGSHYVGKKGPMRGFNLWAQLAGKKWQEDGKPFYLDWEREFKFRAGDTTVSGRTWKFFDTPDESMRDWIYSTLNNWPRARQELKTKHPDPYAYAWYLQDEHSTHGGNYSSIMKQPGGVWTWASTVVAKMQAAAHALHDEAAYNGLVEWADSWPILTHAQAMDLEARCPDHSVDYPLRESA